MDEEDRTSRGLIRELQRLCAEAKTLPSALEGLLDLMAERFGTGRSLAVARYGQRTEIQGRGIPEPELEELVGTLQEEDTNFSEPLGHRLTPGRHSLLNSFRILRFEADFRDFSGALLLEAERVGEWETSVTEVLRETVSSFARVAEFDRLRQRTEAARQEVEHLTLVLDALPDPVLVLDPRERVIMANRRAEFLFQAGSDASNGRRRAVETNNLFFSAFRARSMLGEGEALASDGSDRELVLVNPEDGEDILCEVTALSEPRRGRPRERAVYVLREITDLKRAAGELESHYRRLLAAEHRLRRETERLNVIIENAGIPILVTDDSSDIVLLNREAERLFEVGMQGATESSSFHPMRSNDAALTGLISDFLLQPIARREEAVELTDPAESRRFPARVTLTKISSSRGEPTAVVSVLHDLTSEAENQALASELTTLNAELEERIETAVRELAERNRQLEEQREQLAQASRLKTEFLAMVSHELRTPLNSIMGYSSLLSEGLLGELNGEQVRALRKTRGASEHLLSLINDILDLSKVEAGKMTLTLEEVPVGPFIDEFREGIGHLVDGSAVDLRVRVEKDLPPMRIDATRLRQVLLNLVSNAVKFTEDGFVEVRVGPDPEEERILFEVEDTGIGIEEENLEVIFEGFRQLEDFPTRQQKGTGLGLAISRKLVELMDGRLEVQSVYGEGSTFRFTVPSVPHSEDQDAPTGVAEPRVAVDAGEPVIETAFPPSGNGEMNPVGDKRA